MALTEVDFTIQDALVGLVGKGVPPVEACHKVGVSKRALNAMLRNDQEFKERFDEAIEVMIARVKRVIYERAVDGDSKAWEFFYREWQPHLATQTAASVKAGGPEASVKNTINVAVVAVRELLMSDDAPPRLLGLMHAEVIETVAVEADG